MSCAPYRLTKWIHPKNMNKLNYIALIDETGDEPVKFFTTDDDLVDLTTNKLLLCIQWHPLIRSCVAKQPVVKKVAKVHNVLTHEFFIRLRSDTLLCKQSTKKRKLLKLANASRRTRWKK